jgi:hypothetical protein
MILQAFDGRSNRHRTPAKAAEKAGQKWSGFQCAQGGFANSIAQIAIFGFRLHW